METRTMNNSEIILSILNALYPGETVNGEFLPRNWESILSINPDINDFPSFQEETIKRSVNLYIEEIDDDLSMLSIDLYTQEKRQFKSLLNKSQEDGLNCLIFSCKAFNLYNFVY